MSTLCGKVCGIILKEHFGEAVEKVGNVLFSSGPITLRNIWTNDKIPRKSIQKSLAILIQYGLVSFAPSKSPTTLEYRLRYENVLKLVRYPMYLLLTKKMYGKESEILIEELLRLGRAGISQLVLRAYNRLTADKNLTEVDKVLVQTLRDHFEVMVNKQYVERVSESVEPVDATVRFAPPRIELVTLIGCVSSGAPHSSERILWTLNHPRFHQDTRDEILVTAISRRINSQAGEVLRLVLRLAYLVSPTNAPQSNPVAVSQLRDHARKAKMESKHLEEYLSVIADDKSGFLVKDSLSPSSAYIVNMQKAIEELTWTVLASAVEVRYGVAAARIFRLVREEEYIEQDEIQKRAMLPDKECKFLTYTLVQGGWLQQQELRKGLQKGGPTKNFFLFCIDLGQVVRMFIELCYRSLNNCMSRREYIVQTHCALLDKQQKIDAITLHMQQRGADPADISEIAELITPPEAAVLEKTHAIINKLHQAELQIDSTLFILEMYLESRT